MNHDSSITQLHEYYQRLLEERDRRIEELEQQNVQLHQQLVDFLERENDRLMRRTTNHRNNAVVVVMEEEKKLSFQQLFMEQQNADIWWNVVEFLNGIDMINLTRSHSALLAFYMQYRLLIWRNLVSNEYKLERLTFNKQEQQEQQEQNQQQDENEWIYWKNLYMKKYDFLNRERWRSMSDDKNLKLEQQQIQHDSLSILFIEYNPLVATRFLPKFVPIFDCIDHNNSSPVSPHHSTTHMISTSTNTNTNTTTTTTTNTALTTTTHLVNDSESNSNSSSNSSSSNNSSGGNIFTSLFKKKKMFIGTKVDNLTSEERKMRDYLVNDKHYALISTLHSPIFHIFNLNHAKIEKSFRGHQGTVNEVDPMCTDPFWINRGHVNNIVGVGTLLSRTSSTSFNNRVISASSDATLKIWNLMTGHCLTTLRNGHEGSVYSVRCTNDHLRAISSGHDGSISLWDCNVGSLIHSQTHHSNVAYCVRVDHYYQNNAVSCSRDGTVNLYDLRSMNQIVEVFRGGTTTTTTTTSPVYCVDICNQYVVSGTKSGSLNIWDLRYSSGRPLQSISVSSPTQTMSINRVQLDEVKCAISCSNGSIRFYELNHHYNQQPSSSQQQQQTTTTTATTDSVEQMKVLKYIGKQSVSQLSDFSLAFGTSVSFDTQLVLTGDEKGNICLLSASKNSNRGKKKKRTLN